MTPPHMTILDYNPNKDEIRRCKILIIEDDRMMREVVKRVFSTHGFTQLIEAENGKIGLEKLRTEKPDLVITDIQMPVMDGFEFCRAASADSDKAIANTPILVLTGIERTPASLAAIYSSGASDYLSKPIDPNELLARSLFHLEFVILSRIVKRFKDSSTT